MLGQLTNLSLLLPHNLASDTSRLEQLLDGKVCSKQDHLNYFSSFYSISCRVAENNEECASRYGQNYDDTGSVYCAEIPEAVNRFSGLNARVAGLKEFLLGTESVHLPFASINLLQEFPGEGSKYVSRILSTPQLTPSRASISTSTPFFGTMCARRC
jgi:hypothetical protein